MTWPVLPLAARVKRSRWPAFWLPLVLLWPLLIMVFCLAILLCLLVPAPRRPAFEAVWAAYRMLCALHGTQVKFSEGPQSTWTFALY